MKKPVTLQNIAEASGVSKLTVAKVLNNTGGKNTRVSEETRKKILEHAAKLEYSPNLIASQLAGKHSSLIGIVIDSYAPAVHFDRLATMERYAAAKGYRFLVGQAHENPDKIIEFAKDFQSYRVAGIICLAHQYPGRQREIADAYPEDRTVFLEKPDSTKPFSYVSLDVIGAFADAVVRFHNAGRKKLGLIIQKETLLPWPENVRVQGYINGLKQANLPFDPALIQEVSLQHDNKISDLKDAIHEFVEVQKVDAVICCNDDYAAAFCKGLYQVNIKVPEKVAVIGFDNAFFCDFIVPGLTTYDDNRKEVAYALIDLLMEKIEDQPARTVTVRPDFIQRESF